MNILKKSYRFLLAILLVAAIAFSVTACKKDTTSEKGNQEETNNPTDPSNPTDPRIPQNRIRPLNIRLNLKT